MISRNSHSCRMHKFLTRKNTFCGFATLSLLKMYANNQNGHVCVWVFVLNSQIGIFLNKSGGNLLKSGNLVLMYVQKSTCVLKCILKLKKCSKNVQI